ncbi:hypothetical protein GIB67_000136 [Kingdonia uniflora]|uniref:Protein kinase domain-containing protein n=1 Tax=Kingdonia uniflora TaxID=39325 RepID=A0A7J7P9S8_9MAGN|nr:hypothetical protein GIB67_000136 [Kingdonia uniflora]
MGGQSREEVIILVVIVVVAALSLVSLLLAFSYYCYILNKLSKKHSITTNHKDVEVGREEGELHVFSFKQLHIATGGFGKCNVVGHGGFGSVYKGVLSNGRKIAVKLMDRGGGQGEEEFKMEVELLSRLKSPYLLALIGYCSDNDRKVLVYEFMANGGLQEHLYPQNGKLFIMLIYPFILINKLDLDRILDSNSELEIGHNCGQGSSSDLINLEPSQSSESAKIDGSEKVIKLDFKPLKPNLEGAGGHDPD